MQKNDSKILTLFLLIIIMFGITQFELAQAHQPLVLKGCSIIDGTGVSPVKNAVVVIINGRIDDIGPATKVVLPNNADVIDIKGATVLPGFINAHVHRAYSADRLRSWAESGVTTVRDLAAYPPDSSFELRDDLNKDPFNARLVAAGPMMTSGFVPSGWGYFTFIDSAEKGRSEAERILNEGADQLKLMLESRDYTKSGIRHAIKSLLSLKGYRIRRMSEDVAKAIVEVSHRHGKKVSAHVSLSRDIQTAINAGVDDLAHMVVDKLNDDIIEKVVDAQIYWTPTIEMWKNWTAKGRGKFDTYLLDNLIRFVKAGGKVALGTDYYPNSFELGMPMKEIRWMHEAGMSPLDIITAATKNAAEVCGLGNELGTLLPGNIADVLVIDGNPLVDLGNLTKVKLIIKEGIIIRK